jgi:hypothetical protein
MGKIVLIKPDDFEKIVNYVMSVPINAGFASKCVEVQEAIRSAKVTEMKVENVPENKEE